MHFLANCIYAIVKFLCLVGKEDHYSFPIRRKSPRYASESSTEISEIGGRIRVGVRTVVGEPFRAMAELPIRRD